MHLSAPRSKSSTAYAASYAFLVHYKVYGSLSLQAKWRVAHIHIFQPIFQRIHGTYPDILGRRMRECPTCEPQGEDPGGHAPHAMGRKNFPLTSKFSGRALPLKITANVDTWCFSLKYIDKRRQKLLTVMTDINEGKPDSKLFVSARAYSRVLAQLMNYHYCHPQKISRSFRVLTERFTRVRSIGHRVHFTATGNCAYSLKFQWTIFLSRKCRNGTNISSDERA